MKKEAHLYPPNFFLKDVIMKKLYANIFETLGEMFDYKEKIIFQNRLKEKNREHQ